MVSYKDIQRHLSTAVVVYKDIEDICKHKLTYSNVLQQQH